MLLLVEVRSKVEPDCKVATREPPLTCKVSTLPVSTVKVSAVPLTVILTAEPALRVTSLKAARAATGSITKVKTSSNFFFMSYVVHGYPLLLVAPTVVFDNVAAWRSSGLESHRGSTCDHVNGFVAGFIGDCASRSIQPRIDEGRNANRACGICRAPDGNLAGLIGTNNARSGSTAG